LDIALNTGMRQGEQYSLVWDNVDFDLRLLTVLRSKHGEKRHILNDAALAAFVTAQQYSKPGRSVFWNRLRRTLAHPQAVVRRVREGCEDYELPLA
jgi:integrase